jgi:hypothetical protein
MAVFMCLISAALMAGGVTKENIITLIKAGTPESQIKDLIRREGLDFKSTAATQSDIRAAGGEVSLTAFIYSFGEEYGEAPESKAAREKQTAARRGGNAIPRFFFGLHAGVSFPLGDLKDAVDSNVAATFGIHVDVPVSEDLILRPRLDFANYSGQPAASGRFAPWVNFYGSLPNTTAKTFWAGAELLWGTGAVEGDGGYVGVGIGAQEITGTMDSAAGSLANFNGSSSALGYSLLLGYQLSRHVGTEVRYTSSATQIAKSFLGQNFLTNSLNFSLTYRF